MDDGSVCLKRQRLDEPQPLLMTARKHDSLYIADGNVILCASNVATEYIAFCVHRSMLSAASPVFANMFALPLTNANELHEGLPIVHIPDKAEDLEILLKVIYHKIALPLKRLDPDTPSAVKPILSLAIKYEMDLLKNQIIDRLTDDWPTSLHAWDTLESEIAGMKYRWHKQHVCDSPETCSIAMDAYLPEPVSAINLARECRIPSILPAAFYHLSRVTFEWGPDGSETPSPTTASCPGAHALQNGKASPERTTTDFLSAARLCGRLSLT